MKNLKFLVALLLAINFFGLTACDEQPLGSTDRPATDMTFTVEYRNHGPKTSYGTLGTEKFHTMSSTDTFVSYTLEHYDVSGTLLGTQTNTSLKFRYANVPGGTVWTVLKGSTLSGSVVNLKITALAGISVNAYREINGTEVGARFNFSNRDPGTAPNGTAERGVATNMAASFTIQTASQSFVVNTEAPISENRQLVGSANGNGYYYPLLTTGQRANGTNDTIWSNLSINGKVAGVEVTPQDEWAFLYSGGSIIFLLNGRSIEIPPATPEIIIDPISNSDVIVKMVRKTVADSSQTVRIKYDYSIGPTYPTVLLRESSSFTNDTVYQNVSGLNENDVISVIAWAVDARGNYTESRAQYTMSDITGGTQTQVPVLFDTQDESGQTLGFLEYTVNGVPYTGTQTLNFHEGDVVSYTLLQSQSPAGDDYYPVTQNGQFSVVQGITAQTLVWSTQQQQSGDISGLIPSGETETSVDLDWVANQNNNASNIQVLNGGTVVATLVKTATSYTVSGLTANTLYSFTVKYDNTNGQTVSATTLEEGQEPPVGEGNIVRQSTTVDTLGVTCYRVVFPSVIGVSGVRLHIEGTLQPSQFTADLAALGYTQLGSVYTQKISGLDNIAYVPTALLGNANFVMLNAIGASITVSNVGDGYYQAEIAGVIYDLTRIANTRANNELRLIQ